MDRLKFAATFLLAAVAFPLMSAKPPAGGGGGGSPQISYTHTLGNGTRQLLVANEDGSGSITLYTSASAISSELGSDGRIYFWDGGGFNRMPATGGAVERLFDSGRTLFSRSDLSPDTSAVAWFNPDSRRLYRYNIAANQQNLLLEGPSIIDLTYDRTGQNVIYAQEVGDVDYELKSIPAAGGTPVSLGFTGHISNVDAAHNDDRLVLAVNELGVGPHVELWRPGDATTTRVADGYNGTFRCNDRAILFNRVSGSGAALYRREDNGLVYTVAKASSIFPSYKPIC